MDNETLCIPQGEGMRDKLATGLAILVMEMRSELTVILIWKMKQKMLSHALYQTNLMFLRP